MPCNKKIEKRQFQLEFHLQNLMESIAPHSLLALSPQKERLKSNQVREKDLFHGIWGGIIVRAKEGPYSNDMKAYEYL